MGVMPYHRRFHSDALAGFMSLNLEERGAYQTVLDMIYDRGGPIHDNERLLSGYMNCSVRKWRSLRLSLLEKGKIEIDSEGMISNSRAILELENGSKINRKRVESASSGGRAKSENAKKRNENSKTGLPNGRDLEEQNPAYTRALPLPYTVTNVTGGFDENQKPEPDLKKQVWDQALGLLGDKKRSLIAKWIKDHGLSAVADAVKAASKDEVHDPAPYITGILNRAADEPSLVDLIRQRHLDEKNWSAQKASVDQ
jgi:uncharacterized protein YdaU (DUF1376 family)